MRSYPDKMSEISRKPNCVEPLPPDKRKGLQKNNKMVWKILFIQLLKLAGNKKKPVWLNGQIVSSYRSDQSHFLCKT